MKIQKRILRKNKIKLKNYDKFYAFGLVMAQRERFSFPFKNFFCFVFLIISPTKCLGRILYAHAMLRKERERER